MEILLNDSEQMKDLYSLINTFKLETAEKIISEFIFENSINYIGELNKNDVMF